MGFINGFDLHEFIRFVNLAREKELEEKLFQQWCAMLPIFKTFVPFSEFKDKLTGANIDLRPADEIIYEIKTLHNIAE